MDNRPIGVFDSGVGGLTAVKELHRLLPEESICYFGDTGRVPYGTRGKDVIRAYAAQDIRFLARHGVKAVVAACGTVSSNFFEADVRAMGVGLPFLEIVGPATRRACSLTTGGRIGVIATPAAVRSGAYERRVRAISPEVRLFTNACPLLVPLAENGMVQPDNEIARLTLQMYLEPLLAEHIDTLILGCTHYPLFAAMIDGLLGGSVTLVDAGAAAAGETRAMLAARNLFAEKGHAAVTEYYVTDEIGGFRSVARHFLDEELGDSVTYVDIQTLER